MRCCCASACIRIQLGTLASGTTVWATVCAPRLPHSILWRGTTTSFLYAHRMCRYWDDDDATAAAHLPGGWLRTGDLGCLSQGELMWGGL